MKHHRRSQSDSSGFTQHPPQQSPSHALYPSSSGDLEFSNFGSIRLFEVTFPQRANFGLILSYRADKHVALISGFEFLAASLAGSLQIGDEVVMCGGVNLDGLGKEETAHVIKSAPFPLTMRLRRRVAVAAQSPLKRRTSSPSVLYTDQQHGVSAVSRLRMPYPDSDFAVGGNASSSSSGASNSNSSSSSSSGGSSSSGNSAINSNIHDGAGGTASGNGGGGGGSGSSGETTRVEALASRVLDVTLLTNDIYQASLQLDTHNHVRQQASVMVVGATERLPALIDKVNSLVDDFRAALARLEALEKNTLSA